MKEVADKLASLNDPQVELTLLRSCFSLPKFAFSLRTCPPTFSLKAAEEYDGVMREQLERICGSPFSEAVWNQANLPISMGGIGLRSATQHRGACFVGSVSQTLPLATCISPSYSNPFFAGEMSELGVNSDSHTNLCQKSLSFLVNSASSVALRNSADCRSVTRLLSLTLPHSGDWLTVVPSHSLGLAIPGLDFRYAHRYRLGMPLYTRSFRCPFCDAHNDAFGDHAIGCGHESDRIARHNRLRDVIFASARCANLDPAKELPNLIPGLQARPADIFLPMWRRGRPAAFDVTVVSPLQAAFVNRPGQALPSAESRKRSQHELPCHSQGIDFFPLGVEP